MGKAFAQEYECINLVWWKEICVFTSAKYSTRCHLDELWGCAVGLEAGGIRVGRICERVKGSKLSCIICTYR